ncbi:unnamed protein product [Chrysoparadoxa australica]
MVRLLLCFIAATALLRGDAFLTMSTSPRIYDTVVVTGASTGLGREIALESARVGHPVIALGKAGPELEALGEELDDIISGCATVECDLADADSMARASQALMLRTKRIAALIHNAGQMQGESTGPMGKSTTSNFKKDLEVNLLGPDYLTRRLLPLLGDGKASARGVQEKDATDSVLPRKLLSRVAVVTSGAAFTPVPSHYSYCVAKAGLVMWARCAAAELASSGVSVISVQPGGGAPMEEEIKTNALATEELVPSQVHEMFQPDAASHKRAVEEAKRLLPILLYHPIDFSGEAFDSDDSDNWDSLMQRCRPGVEYASSGIRYDSIVI